MTERRRDENGSALMLLPTAVLVVFLLGAISLDAAVRFQAQRAAVADAQSIAHDLASAVSGASIRATGSVDGAPLDRAEVARRIAADIRARRLTGQVQWNVDGDVVTVVVTRRTPLVFSPVVPGGPSSAIVTGRAAARLVPHRP